jgi:hypothetical protein
MSGVPRSFRSDFDCKKKWQGKGQGNQSLSASLKSDTQTFRGEWE